MTMPSLSRLQSISSKQKAPLIGCFLLLCIVVFEIRSISIIESVNIGGDSVSVLYITQMELQYGGGEKVAKVIKFPYFRNYLNSNGFT